MESVAEVQKPKHSVLKIVCFSAGLLFLTGILWLFVITPEWEYQKWSRGYEQCLRDTAEGRAFGIAGCQKRSRSYFYKNCWWMNVGGRQQSC